MSDFFENSVEKSEEKIAYSAPESIEIKMSTCGKLDCPPKIRVTDYLMEDILKLSGVTEENLFTNLIEIVQARLQDDFDARKLHENEFEEILLTIYGNFWSRIISEYPYPWEEQELEELVKSEIITKERADTIRKGEYIPRVDINIPSIQIDEISEKFAEPIVITHNDVKVGLRLPRIGDYLLTEEYLLKKYAVKDKRYSDIKLAIRNNKTDSLDPQRVMEYQNYEKERAIDYLRIKQALLLVFTEKDGVKQPLTTIEDKLHFYKRMNKKFWDVFMNEVEKIKFGVNHEVKMISPFTKEEVTRRCLFQVMDFIPTDELPDSTGYSVSFGDVS